MLEADQIFEVLGGRSALGRDDLSGVEWHDLVSQGLRTKILETLVDRRLLTKNEIYRLVVSRRTLDRRKSERHLSPEESDRLFRIVRVIARANDVFGEPGKAADWLRRPNRSLEGRTPMDLMDNAAGAGLVETVLGRIAHGVYS